jgi:hypothetical protein
MVCWRMGLYTETLSLPSWAKERKKKAAVDGKEGIPRRGAVDTSSAGAGGYGDCWTVRQPCCLLQKRGHEPVVLLRTPVPTGVKRALKQSMIRSASPNRMHILACVLGPHETYYSSTVLLSPMCFVSCEHMMQAWEMQ